MKFTNASFEGTVLNGQINKYFYLLCVFYVHGMAAKDPLV